MNGYNEMRLFVLKTEQIRHLPLETSLIVHSFSGDRKPPRGTERGKRIRLCPTIESGCARAAADQNPEHVKERIVHRERCVSVARN